MRIVPEIQCQVAILSRATALLVLRQTGVHLVHQQRNSLVMVTCSLDLILVLHHSMASNLMAATLQHLEVIRQGGISLQTSNHSSPPLALAMTTITNSSNPNSNNLPLELLHLLMLATTITASLLLVMLHKGMVILPTLSRVAGSKLMTTLVTRPKGSSSLTRSSLDMISRAMGHLAMDQLLTQLKMVLHRAMVVQVALVKHLQGSKLQLHPLEAKRVILANHLLVLLHQATRRKALPLHLDTLLHRHSLAMVRSHHHRARMVRVLMGSLRKLRSRLHLLLLMDRHRLLRLVMGSMDTVSKAMVHRRLTLVHPLLASQAMASSSHTVILMLLVAMGSLQRILLKLQHLLRPRINPLPHLRLAQQLPLLLLPTVVPPKLLRVELPAPASAASAIWFPWLCCLKYNPQFMHVILLVIA